MRRDYEPTFHCRVCEDGGWALVYCPGSGDARANERHERYTGVTLERCEHPRDHREHSAAKPCHCRESNPVIAKQRERHAAAIGKLKTGKGRAS